VLGYSIASATGFVAMNKEGNGTLKLIVTPSTTEPTKSVSLNILGANIVKVQSEHKGVFPVGTKIKINMSPPTETVYLDVQFASLIANEQVVISSTNERDLSAKDIVLKIRGTN
jgi:hypothetical protein